MPEVLMQTPPLHRHAELRRQLACPDLRSVIDNAPDAKARKTREEVAAKAHRIPTTIQL